MLFSLFGRKDKIEPRRGRPGAPPRSPDTLRGPTTGAGLELQRELARRTAEKIDQIESEMIDGASHGAGAAPVTNPAPVTLPMPARRPPAPAAGGASVGAGWQPALDPRDLQSAFGGTEEALAGARAPAAPLPPLEFSTSVLLGDTLAGSGGIQVGTSTLPAELEEAAILFANAQTQAAQATLRSAISAGMLGDRTRQGWLMLLDVLQALGERAQFDSVALEFAARFEVSPPPWQEVEVAQATPRSSPPSSTVRFGARLDETCARHTEQARRAAATGKQVAIDLSAVVGFDQEGANLVCDMLEQFAREARNLSVQGADRLLAVARASIETGRPDAEDGGWKLALVALRMLGDRQAFDDLAIDYCVTYEVSPPSWEPMPASVRVAAGGASAAVPATAPASGTKTVSARAGQIGESGAFALRGEISGRMVAELAALRAFASDRDDVVIDCRALRRLDFVAAGELLNEVVVTVGQGRSVLFAEPSAIVEALLVVMGIHEVAEIRRRRS